LGRRPDLPPDSREQLSALPPVKPLPAPRPKKKDQAGSSRQRFSATAMIVIVALAGVLAGALGGVGSSEGGHQRGRVGETSRRAAGVAPASGAADPFAPLQWYLGPAADGGAGITAYREKTGARGDGVTVALVDTGVRLSHPDLTGLRARAHGADLVSD